jgi:putative membrane protein
MNSKNRPIWIIISTSIVIPVLVAILFFSEGIIPLLGDWVYSLPQVNAIINSVTAILLIAGKYQIRMGNKELHKRLMITSFILGIVFLLCYVTYHASVPSTHYQGEGFLKYIYFFLLVTHIITAIIVVPFVLLALFYALQENFFRHRKIVKYAHPLWLYVSITGVIVYLMISPYY